MITSHEARERAHQLLRLVGIEAPPVDVERVAWFLGFIVIKFEFPDSVSAVTFIEREVRSIGVNSAHPHTRRRFSIAHEIGHFLCGHESFDEEREATHIENRRTFMDSQNQQEREANEFASELLMCEEFLRRDVQETGLDVPLLARRYQVSEQAMWIQLMDLNLAVAVPTTLSPPTSAEARGT